MLREYVGNIILKTGFFKADINLNSIDVYIERATGDNKIVVVLDLCDEKTSREKYEKIVKKIMDRCIENGFNCYKCLSIILCDKYKLAEKLGYVEYINNGTEFNELLIVDKDKNVYPDRMTEEANNSIREKILSNVSEKSESSKQVNTGKTKRARKKRRAYSFEHNQMMEYMKMSVVHIAIVNMIIFIITDLFLSDNLQTIFFEYGSSWKGIAEKKQIYRLITSLFLHSGIDHISGNMISLLIIGIFLERNIGRYKLLFIYFSTGIIADLVSIRYNMYVGNLITPSVGASGAIFGLTGAFLALLFIQKDRASIISAKRMILFIVLSLYGGIASSDSIDNAAHIGGLLSGMLITVIIFYVVPNLKAKIKNSK